MNQSTLTQHSSHFFISNHNQRRLDCITFLACWFVFSEGNVYLIHPCRAALSACHPPHSVHFSLGVYLSLSSVSASDPLGWFQHLRMWWLIPSLDTWKTNSQQTALQQELFFAWTLWWITGLLIHTKDNMRGRREGKKPCWNCWAERNRR